MAVCPESHLPPFSDAVTFCPSYSITYKKIRKIRNLSIVRMYTDITRKGLIYTYKAREAVCSGRRNKYGCVKVDDDLIVGCAFAERSNTAQVAVSCI